MALPVSWYSSCISWGVVYLEMQSFGIFIVIEVKKNTEDYCGCSLVCPKWGSAPGFAYSASRKSNKKVCFDIIIAHKYRLYHHVVYVEAIQLLDNTYMYSA